MNKLAFRILNKIVSKPGIDRRTLVAEIQKEHPASPHEIAVVIADLRNQELLTEGDQGFQPLSANEEFYQKMQPYSDDEVLDLLINYLNKHSGPSVMTNLNNDLQLHLNREDEDYYEALLAENDFVKTTYPSGPTIPTFFISDKGKINLRKHGGYLNYLEAQKPKPVPEDIVLKYIENELMYDPVEVLKMCGIDIRLMNTILAVLGDKIHKYYGAGNSFPYAICISDEGLRYLYEGPKTSVAKISYIHNDHSSHTHGPNSPVVSGNFAARNMESISIGSMSNSSIQQGTYDSLGQIITRGQDELASILVSLRAIQDGLDNSIDVHKELISEIETLASQQKSPRPKGIIVTTSLNAIKAIIEKIAVNAATPAVVDQITHFLSNHHF